MLSRVLLACSLFVAGASAASPAAGVTVILIRDAESALSANPDPGLSDLGRERAKCWVDEPQLRGLTHIFVSPYLSAKETSAPIVAAARPVIVKPRDPQQLEVFSKELRALPDGSRALYIADARSLPKLAAMLGAPLSGLDESAGRTSIPNGQHDRIAVIDLAPDGTSRLTEARHDCPAAWRPPPLPPSEPAPVLPVADTEAEAPAPAPRRSPASAEPRGALPKSDVEKRMSQLSQAMLARDGKALYALRTPEFRRCVSEAEFKADLAASGDGTMTRFRATRSREAPAEERSGIECQCSDEPLAPERAVIFDVKAKLRLPDGTTESIDDIIVGFVLLEGEWWWYDWSSESLDC